MCIYEKREPCYIRYAAFYRWSALLRLITATQGYCGLLALGDHMYRLRA